MKAVLVRLPFYSLFKVNTSKMKTYPLNLLGLATYLQEVGGYKAAVVDGENLPLSDPVRSGQDKGDPAELVRIGISRMIRTLEDPDHSLWTCLTEKILGEKPDVVGISCDSVGMDAARIVVQKLRPCGLPVILGGPHPTALPEHSLLYTGAHMAVMGEGEDALLHLLDAMNGRRRFDQVPSLAWKRHGEIRVNGRAKFIDPIERLPIADRSFIRRKDYFGDVIITGRGCPYHCTFCASRTVWGGKVRLRSIPSIIEELRRLLPAHGRKDEEPVPSNRHDRQKGSHVVKIIDDTFTIDKGRTMNLLDEIVSSGLTCFEYTCGVRADTIDHKLATKMKQANVKRVTLGIESGSPRILKMIRKGEPIGVMRRAIRILRDAGIWTHAFFMIGFPGETLADIERTKAFILESEPDHVEINMVTPYPGTDLFDKMCPGDPGEIERWYQWFHQGLSTHPDQVCYDLDQTFSDVLAFANQYNTSKCVETVSLSGQ